MRQSLAFLPALAIALLGSFALLSHSLFFYQADGYMSPRTAETLGLLTKEAAAFSGGLAFQKSPAGGYTYREGRAITFFGKTHHTYLALEEACTHLGGCEPHQR